jgi:tetrathionate reductase subunit B
MERREFLKKCCATGPVLLAVGRLGASEQTPEGQSKQPKYDATQHCYGMAVDVAKCIGCGRCAEACKTENDVPREPQYFRTWIERYTVLKDGETTVESPNGGINGFPAITNEKGIERAFYVPKLCNHCASPPCVQVCPIGATFTTRDGVVLVDPEYCMGCCYCIEACPYGMRFMNPVTRVADKCTFCYHRVVRGLSPACVEVCPTQARIFGEVARPNSPLTHFRRLGSLQVLKPELNAQPKVYYANLVDGEVR